MPSFATITSANTELTPVRVTFKGVDLGATLGNCVVAWKTEKSEIHADQLGTSVLDRRFAGLHVTVTTELAEVQNKTIWKSVFPSQDLVTSSTKLLEWSIKVGASDLSNAGTLVLHPLSHVDSDKSGDINVDLACADENSEIIYGPKDQVRLKIVWNVLPNTAVQPARFMTFGDPAVGMVAATAGTPVFTGTGTETMGSVSVGASTVTETITALCIHSSGTAIFQVTGSVSGPLGNASVGTPFISSKLNFTISGAGSVIGDSFSVATTAANYV